MDTLGRLLAAAGHDVGSPERLEVIERSDSGRVSKIRVEGRSGQTLLSGRNLRAIVGEHTLRSTLFEVRQEGDRAIIVGTGRGHGVGMSQWAAQAMAQSGRDYREILEAFYPGTRIERRGRTSATRNAAPSHESRTAAPPEPGIFRGSRRATSTATDPQLSARTRQEVSDPCRVCVRGSSP